jgi:hypothetical protein
MGYSIEVRPGAPIIWITWEADFDIQNDTPVLAREELRILNTAQQPMVAVYDTRAFSQSWDDILLLSSKATSTEMSGHPNLLGRILITNDEASAVVAKNLDNETFGNLEIHPVSSEEEALALAHHLLG